MENKIKHLEMLQNTITRMSGNSFLLKGWTVTLMTGIFVLSDKDSNPGADMMLEEGDINNSLRRIYSLVCLLGYGCFLSASGTVVSKTL